jgi:Protein of unknown function (DUF3455)
VITRLLQMLVVLAIVAVANGQTIQRPDVPEKIQPSADEQVILVAHASGSQVYICQEGTDGKFAWTLKGPDAELHDGRGAVIGRHYAGPTWKDNDGSEVTAKATARVDSPDTNSIPWLLLAATGHAGSGVLSQVSTVQCVHTKGGQPSASEVCNSSKKDSESKSSYTADYYFYAKPR